MKECKNCGSITFNISDCGDMVRPKCCNGLSIFEKTGRYYGNGLVRNCDMRMLNYEVTKWGDEYRSYMITSEIELNFHIRGVIEKDGIRPATKDEIKQAIIEWFDSKDWHCQADKKN